LDEIWQAGVKYHADYGDIINIETGSRIPIWQMFMCPQQK